MHNHAFQKQTSSKIHKEIKRVFLWNRHVPWGRIKVNVIENFTRFLFLFLCAFCFYGVWRMDIVGWSVARTDESCRDKKDITVQLETTEESQEIKGKEMLFFSWVIIIITQELWVVMSFCSLRSRNAELPETLTTCNQPASSSSLPSFYSIQLVKMFHNTGWKWLC